MEIFITADNQVSFNGNSIFHSIKHLTDIAEFTCAMRLAGYNTFIGHERLVIIEFLGGGDISTLRRGLLFRSEIGASTFTNNSVWVFFSGLEW